MHNIGITNVLNRDEVVVANMLIGMGVKLFFAGTLSLESVVMQSAAERKLDDRRRQFLRYVFHEIRVPLNTITMGITVLKEEAM
jgi:signal transduction histidine kinase